MAVTSGFFNSLNGDRQYTNNQLAALFDGVITDGVFINLGQALQVTAGSGNTISVGTGKAWFDWIWLINDSILNLDLDAAHLLLNRYDAVIVEVDKTEAVRNGAIKFITGTPASEPQLPVMVHTEDKNQYPLAYIYRGADTDVILPANITDKRGTADCPYASGIMNVSGSMASLVITEDIAPNTIRVGNVIYYPSTGPTPSTEGVPDGTMFVKYIP